MARTTPARGAVKPLGLCDDTPRARKVRQVNTDQELP